MNDDQPETDVIDNSTDRMYLGRGFVGIEFPIDGIDDYCRALQQLADHNHQEQQ